jgi:hypothetical protein
LFRQERPGDFDKAEVDDVVDDGGAVRVEEHHLNGRLDAWSLDGGRSGR